MSDNEMVVAITSMAFTFGTIITVVRLWVNRSRSAGAPPAQLDPVMDRLLRIEQTLDSVAIEVERISEAQRFTTKLLSDREKVPALSDNRLAR